MKWVARLLVFSVALMLGVFAGTVTYSLDLFNEQAALSCKYSQLSLPETGIKVTYDGLGQNEYDAPTLRFTIHNGLNRPIKYSAHSPSTPFPQLKFNGRAAQFPFTCGTGIQTFYIQPGAEATFTISRYDFAELPKDGDMVTVGFYLNATAANEWEMHWSDGFLLPREFREVLRKPGN